MFLFHLLKERIFFPPSALHYHAVLQPPPNKSPAPKGLGPINNSLSNLLFPSDQVFSSQPLSISHLPRNSINTSSSPSVRGLPLLMSRC